MSLTVGTFVGTPCYEALFSIAKLARQKKPKSLIKITLSSGYQRSYYQSLDSNLHLTLTFNQRVAGSSPARVTKQPI